MHRTGLAFVLSALVAATAPAQQAAQKKVLSLETVLTAGRSLAVDIPRVVWHPGGHDATLIVHADGGGQRLISDPDLGPGGWNVEGAALAEALGLGVEGPARIPPCTFAAEGVLRFELPGRVVSYDLATETARTVLSWPASASSHLVAPGDERVAYVYEHDLWIVSTDGPKRRLTHDGSPDIVYGGAAHRAEFGITTGLFWSDDGDHLAFSREDMRPIAVYPYQDLETKYPAPVHGRYPMAGLPHSKVSIGFVDARTGATSFLDRDPAEDVYWTNLAVTDDGKVWTARVGRGQDHMELVRYDGASGRREAVLLREHDPEWIEPEHAPVMLSDGRFLWWSRRDGWRHLWLCDADGTVRNLVTPGDHDVQALLGHDDERVWFQASGEDPRQLHLFVATIDGSSCRRLTTARGRHDAELSPDRKLAYVVHSNLETPPHAYLLDLDRGGSRELPAPHNPWLDYSLPEQRFFTVEADDGSTLYGHVALPPDLKEGERRPVLLYVYGGPHVQLVTDRWLGGAALWLQAYAAEGYILCRLDNRGTPNRGIEFEQKIFRHLGTHEVDDQLKAVAWLRKQPFADCERIGVHGWSFGGYMTLRLLLTHPEAFACGISGAPVTDWAFYETGYTERYMDTPKENEKGYAGSSCLPLAKRLERPLLLVHGTDDRTVMWVHTLRFVDRCIDAGTTLRYFPYPMQKHGLRGRDRVHFLRMMREFLHEQLGL